MTHKQRILAAVGKQPVDKLPFGARIDLWYNYHRVNGTLPERYRDYTEIEILRDLGAGGMIVLGGEGIRSGKSGGGRIHTMWDISYENLEVAVTADGPVTTTEYMTPKGRIRTKTEFNLTEGYLQGYAIERLFKSEADYPAIEFLVENSVLTPEYNGYLRLAELIGDDGLIRCGVRTSPMQYIMRDLMGFEAFFYELADHPAAVQHLYEVVKRQWKRQLHIIAESPATVVTVCSNWSDEIHTPVFRQFFTPWLQEATEFLHSKGKLTLIHADGEMKRLIPLVLDTGIDVAEAWSPVPMTSVTTAELREAWGDKITIWGGLPTIIFEPTYTDEQFEAYVMNLFREIAPGNNFILGMGDNFPIDGDINRIRQIVELIDKYDTHRVK
jgi:hypothetical protein